MQNPGIPFGPRMGLGNAASYQSSGTPLTTGSVFGASEYWIKVSFPKVTKSFTIINKDPQQLHPSGSHTGGGPLYVFFGPEPSSSVGLPEAVETNHFITIPALEDSMTFDVKCKEFFVGVYATGTNVAFQLLAELTSIDSSEMFELSGSGYNKY